jgi:hypothetical protein
MKDACKRRGTHDCHQKTRRDRGVIVRMLVPVVLGIRCELRFYSTGSGWGLMACLFDRMTSLLIKKKRENL